MLNIEKTYREKLEEFQDNLRKISDYVWQIYPEPSKATVDDLVELRKLTDKIEEAACIADSFLRMRMLRSSRDRWLNS